MFLLLLLLFFSLVRACGDKKTHFEFIYKFRMARFLFSLN